MPVMGYCFMYRVEFVGTLAITTPQFGSALVRVPDRGEYEPARAQSTKNNARSSV